MTPGIPCMPSGIGYPGINGLTYYPGNPPFY